MGVRGCARVCTGVHRCAWICMGMCGYAWVCTCVWDDFQNFFWRIESLHQRTLIRFLYEFLMHISSFFIGCKGNDNRFFSVESCVNTCGGNEPETDAKCKDVTCDVSMASFMKAKGCVPKIKPRSKSFTSLIYADLKT